MKFGSLLGLIAFGYLLLVDEDSLVDARHHHHHHHPHHHHHHHHHHHKKKGFFRRMLHKVKKGIGRLGRKLLDKPPKHRSRFDKYPIHLIRYHQFIWHRYFKRYLNHVHDGRPNLPSTKCWSIRCWRRRNKFKRYWYKRAPIPRQGKNSSPFLHRRCRMPNARTGRCRKEHLRHDYFWRMFMWVGRYGFPKQPVRKRFCVTSYCRLQKKIWKRYWKNFFIYSSLIPIIRPYDHNWKFWMWRHRGNIFRLRQIVSPALMAMGMGHNHMMMGGGAMMFGISGGHHMTIEMKQALLAVMQRNLAQSMHVAQTSQQALQRQRMALMMLMRMPAYPSALSAQLQMRSMMQNMNYQQQMQQWRMQMMLRQQIMGMAQYLRGSCGCGMCSHAGMHYGMSGARLPGGAAMYVRHNGIMGPVNPALMARQLHGSMALGGIGGGFGMHHHITMPYNAIHNPMELKMRVQALYNKNNVHGYA